jgi:hypothetical protein
MTLIMSLGIGAQSTGKIAIDAITGEFLQKTPFFIAE